MKPSKTCALCGSTNIFTLYVTHDRMFDIKGDFLVKRCRSCSLVFTDPQPSNAVLKRHYPPTSYYSYRANEKKDFFGMLREYLIRRSAAPTLVSRLLGIFMQVPAMPSAEKTGKILDIGCGTGDTLKLLSKIGWDAFGLEIDKQAVHIARQRGLSHVFFGTDANITKYPDNFFDVIRLYHVIEHIKDPFSSLERIRRKLKKGGELIIGTPNYESLAGRIFGKYWYNLDTPRHVFLFSPRTLQLALFGAGFTQARVQYCSAGGIAGSLQYVAEKIFKRKFHLLDKLWLVLFLYPMEWALDKFHMGDVFVIRIKK